jgi:hypothetical protein
MNCNSQEYKSLFEEMVACCGLNSLKDFFSSHKEFLRDLEDASEIPTYSNLGGKKRYFIDTVISSCGSNSMVLSWDNTGILFAKNIDQSLDKVYLEIVEIFEDVTFEVSDGNCTNTFYSLEECVEVVESWYDYLNEDRKTPISWKMSNNINNLEELNSYIEEMENDIAEQLGYSNFQGHGNYSVNARSAAGLNLSVTRKMNYSLDK